MKYILLFIALLNIPAAFADSGSERLQEFSNNLRTLRAEFAQILYDQRQQEVQRTEGTVILKRPGKFRWDYQKPYQQQIVSDGKQLWVYDAELQQVTVKPVDNALGAAPISLLSESRTLAEDFLLQDLGAREGLLWVELEPKIKDTDFNKIYLGMDKKQMRVMELRDNFGQVTQIQFKDMQTNIELAEDAFQFTPPPGVDIIGQP